MVCSCVLATVCMVSASNILSPFETYHLRARIPHVLTYPVQLWQLIRHWQPHMSMIVYAMGCLTPKPKVLSQNENQIWNLFLLSWGLPPCFDIPMFQKEKIIWWYLIHFGSSEFWNSTRLNTKLALMLPIEFTSGHYWMDIPSSRNMLVMSKASALSQHCKPLQQRHDLSPPSGWAKPARQGAELDRFRRSGAESNVAARERTETCQGWNESIDEFWWTPDTQIWGRN